MSQITDSFFSEDAKNTNSIPEIDSDNLDNLDNLDKFIVDLSIDLETRLKALDLYYSKHGDNTVELITKLGMMYELSGIKIIRQYLYVICEKSTISPFLKTFAGKALHSVDAKDQLAYQALDLIYPSLDIDVATPYKIDILKILMQNDDYKEKTKDHFCQTINDDRINCEYRFKAIVGLEYKPSAIDKKISPDEREKIIVANEEKANKMKWFMKAGYLTFIRNVENILLYRILAGQTLLQGYSLLDEEKKEIEDIILQIAENTDNEYNIRADASDVLLSLGSDQCKNRAKEIIMILGKNGNIVRTIYDNAQNVHSIELEKSIEEALEFLHSFNVMLVNEREIDLDYVTTKIYEHLSEHKEYNVEKIQVSLNRIQLDRALYSKYNCTLAHVLLRVWTYMVGNKNEDEMKKRLMEELEEMAGTCSSGFITRLINSISGFGDFSMKISWKDQIIANLSGRLNARIRDMDNIGLMEKVLEQMTLESDKYSDRKQFLKFFRQNILSIREEMYEEFKGLISDTDFDLHFRSAISVYETGRK